MSAIPASFDRPAFLRRTLLVDAVLLEVAGLALLPIAALIAWVATRTSLTSLVIAGNLAWVGASMLLLVWTTPTLLGYAFVIVQAAVVTLITALEWTGLQRTAG